jgi:hypothetical protein
MLGELKRGIDHPCFGDDSGETYEDIGADGNNVAWLLLRGLRMPPSVI